MGGKAETGAEIGRAEQLLARGRRADAVLLFHEVRHEAGKDPGLQYRLGRLAFNFGDVDQAVEHFEAATEAAPENADYLGALGISLQQGGHQERAFAVFERALALNPNLADALHGIGVYYLQRSRFDDAVDYLERAVKARPSDVSMRSNLANALTGADRHDDAIRHARKAIKLDPANANAHYELCKALTQTGRMEETTRHLEETVRKHKTFGPAYDLLARVRKFTASDDGLIGTAENALEKSMPPMHRYSLCYALGKMHADRGDYDRSFAHYENANRLQDPGFDVKRDTRRVRDVRRVFTRTTLRDLASSGSDSKTPVFIMGMPRTGTTLMEQLIAAHPDAAGAGELPAIGRIASKIFPEGGTRNVRAQANENLTPDKCGEYAAEYLQVLTQGREEAERVVDKMPSNFLFAGLIAVLFPNATLIHAVRNPLDTALSCYRQNFASLPWTNSFESIAQFYGLYRDMMQYWQKVLPPGRIVDIHYERLVEEPESEARRLLEACGLDWDPSVLDNFRKGRVVRTASIAQVRQPVYKTSQRAWVNYAAHLEPLAKALAPWLTEQRAELAEHGIRIGAGPGLLRRIMS